MGRMGQDLSCRPGQARGGRDRANESWCTVEIQVG
jgi:hypothetical protein